MEVAECIGGPSLAGVMRLLAQDHAGWAGVLRAVIWPDMHQSLFVGVCGMVMLLLLDTLLC